MNDPSDAAGDQDCLAQYTVIMVDDEQNILQSLKRCFRPEPYGMVFAASGAEGLRLLAETERVAVIVSDQRMPVMNGSEFLTRSRALAPDAIRMLLTGYSDMETTVAAMNEGGATHYIGKPWEDATLRQTVRDCVRQYHLAAENRRQQIVINEQNEELSSWNQNLKGRVMAQTAQLRKQMEDLRVLNRSQQENFHGVVASLVALVELRSEQAQQHSAHTAALSVGVAQSLGLSPPEVETVRIAALLHDIGKSALSEGAPGSASSALSVAGSAGYRKHPVLGQTALDSMESLRPAGVLIRHHHERHDGAGFPDGLSGAAIPEGAAIIALADACDREISRHAGANAVELALAALGKLAGAAFSPALLPHLAGPAHDLYDRRFAAHDEKSEQIVAVAHLTCGMTLTRDLFSNSGLLLLPAWSELDQANIVTLQRIFTIDPKPGGIHVAEDPRPGGAAK
jgi:putative nucleotidyltransferase with HDIG domain